MLFRTTTIAAALLLMTAVPTQAQVVPAAGYVYDAQLLGVLTQTCIAAGPGGTFVAVGPGFTANAQSIVLAKESGELRLVASGFSSVGDCAYDAASDVLYVTDNADNTDLGITIGSSNTGAQTGDTVFAVPGASQATGLLAPDLELLPADTFESAASIAIDGGGNLFVGDALGVGLGTVTEITPGPVASLFAGGFDFTGGLAVEPISGDVFVAESLATFDNQITRFDAAGTPVAPVPFAGPSFGFGSFDLAFNTDGTLLTTGVFFGDVVAFDLGGVSAPLVQGLTFATGSTVNDFTGRVELLSSTFSGADEDKSIHRFVPVDRLVAGSGSEKTECIQEFYGLELVGSPAKDAVCIDGDACDADGLVNDRCTFPVGFCFNIDDPAFPDCDDSADVTEVSVKAKPFSPALQNTVDVMAASLPVGGPSCFFSDGYVVPVKITGSGAKKDGKAKLTIKSWTSDNRKDSDNVKLVCQPAP